MKRQITFLLLATILAGCTRSGPPAPVANLGVVSPEYVPQMPAVRPDPVQAAALSPPVYVPVAQPVQRKVVFINTPQPASPRLAAPSPQPAPVQLAPKSSPAALPEQLQRYAANIGTTRFLWPVRGRVLSGFGPKNDGLYNDGINIAAPKGTPVMAAGEGVVAYVGNGLGSYGNLVLIRHKNGVMTAYAHMATVVAKQGAKVKKGQVIGSVGATGAVASSQLHFEIRQGGDAVDPTKYLG